MKKLLIGLVTSLAFYGPLFANYVPYDFEAAGRLLYLQPTGSNLHYAAEAEPLPLPSPNWKIHDIKPHYHVGFELGLRTNFCSGNTDLSLNWTHFHSKDTASKTVDAEDMIGPFFEIGPDAAAYSSASGKAVYNYNSFNLDYGVRVALGNYVCGHLFTGIGAASIKQKLVFDYSNADGTISRCIHTPSSFVGAGPQIGLDLSGTICDGFKVTGRGSATLLVGSQKNHTKYESISPFLEGLEITPPNEQKTDVNNRMQVVPALEGRIGLSYSCCFDTMKIVFECGYEARYYVNAIQTVDIGSEVVTPPVVPDTIGVFARTFQRNISNFALAGPYLSLDIAF